jgi:hypothetical protein
VRVERDDSASSQYLGAQVPWASWPMFKSWQYAAHGFSSKRDVEPSEPVEWVRELYELDVSNLESVTS